jgi:hypothetical protein
MIYRYNIDKYDKSDINLMIITYNQIKIKNKY